MLNVSTFRLVQLHVSQKKPGVFDPVSFPKDARDCTGWIKNTDDKSAIALLFMLTSPGLAVARLTADVDGVLADEDLGGIRSELLPFAFAAGQINSQRALSIPETVINHVSDGADGDLCWLLAEPGRIQLFSEGYRVAQLEDAYDELGAILGKLSES